MLTICRLADLAPLTWGRDNDEIIAATFLELKFLLSASLASYFFIGFILLQCFLVDFEAGDYLAY